MDYARLWDFKSKWHNTYGHKFRWTDDHLTEDEISHLLHSYDTLGSQALDHLDVLSPPISNASICQHNADGTERDLYRLLRDNAPKDDVLGQLWKEVSTLPEWVDWDQIERGQRVVYRYNGQIVLGLLFKSLLGGMAAHRVVETLSRTGGFSVSVTRRRLLETFQHFMDVVTCLEDVKPGGKGHVSTVRVRLLHAAVRRRILTLEKERPGYFDTETLGVPINDLHSMGTIATYSCSLIWLALPRQGIWLSDSEIRDYLALWRWIGHVLGTPTDWMTSPARAKAMLESIGLFELDPSKKSKILAQNILIAESHVPPLYATRGYLVAEAHQLNGNVLTDALGIERPTLWYRMLVLWQCVLLMYVSYLYPWLPESIREKKDARFRRIANNIIMGQKSGGGGKRAGFQFQYVPGHDKTTELGEVRTLNVVIPKGSSPRWRMVLLLALIAFGVVGFFIQKQIMTRWWDGLQLRRPQVSTRVYD